jgi:hypothetical protein
VVVVPVVLVGLDGAGVAVVAVGTVVGVCGVCADIVVSQTSAGSTAEISRKTRSQTRRLWSAAPSVAMRSCRSEASAGFC